MSTQRTQDEELAALELAQEAQQEHAQSPMVLKANHAAHAAHMAKHDHPVLLGTRSYGKGGMHHVTYYDARHGEPPPVKGLKPVKVTQADEVHLDGKLVPITVGMLVYVVTSDPAHAPDEKIGLPSDPHTIAAAATRPTAEPQVAKAGCPHAPDQGPRSPCQRHRRHLRPHGLLQGLPNPGQPRIEEVQGRPPAPGDGPPELVGDVLDGVPPERRDVEGVSGGDRHPVRPNILPAGELLEIDIPGAPGIVLDGLQQLERLRIRGKQQHFLRCLDLAHQTKLRPCLVRGAMYSRRNASLVNSFASTVETGRAVS